jgi:flagellar basal-body rod modification protein FlgD
MGTAAALLNHQLTAGQVLTRTAATPTASATSGTGSTGSTSTSDDGATISANDFLTLLVTEMQNQDPTSDTDPNEYINQLVNVNSLEQLIDINQTLTTDLGSPSSTSGATTQVSGAASSPASLAAPASAAASPRTAAQLAGSPLTSSPLVSSVSASQASSAQHFSGNLSAPNPSPAARRVGHALAGRTHADPVQGTSSGTQ